MHGWLGRVHADLMAVASEQRHVNSEQVQAGRGCYGVPGAASQVLRYGCLHTHYHPVLPRKLSHCRLKCYDSGVKNRISQKWPEGTRYEVIHHVKQRVSSLQETMTVTCMAAMHASQIQGAI